jgi:hypothetical protein
MKATCLIIALPCVLAEPCRAHTATISLNPVADTSLFELAPTNNLGAAATLVAGTNGQLAKSRALVRFDLAAVFLPTQRSQQSP